MGPMPKIKINKHSSPDKIGRLHLFFKNNKNHVLQIRTTMSRHDFVMLRHRLKVNNDRHNMLRHKRIMPRHVALRFFVWCRIMSRHTKTMPRHAHQHSLFSAPLVIFFFSSILLLKYHLQDKNHM